MSDPNHESSGLKRVLATLGHSAEYSIALGLIVVCVVVGAALWFIDSEHKTAAPAADQASARPRTAVGEAEEKAALEGWNRQLQGDFKQIEQQQKKAADEAAARERQRQDAERAERAAAERERKAREEAAAAAAAAERQRAQQAARAVAVVGAPRPVVRIEPAIDWSSCRRPQYPRYSVERREEGVVTVGVDLDASGKVLDGRIVESSGHGQLDVVAQRAIAKCLFRPATVDGVAQPATANVRFTWKLQN